MIRDGKAEGWLQLPPEALSPWAMLNDVDFKRVVPGAAVGKGGALLAKQDLRGDDGGEGRILMTVPRDLILSLERVLEHAKVDADFREVLASLGDFGRTPRGAILTFILLQASISCPHLRERTGVHSPFTDYVKSLPCELLPTFWTLSELQLLVGTTLAPAVASKMKSLRREYELLCSVASKTKWYHVVRDRLEYDDWLLVDAMYRSRALDYPGIGHCMVPCIDLANHTAGEATTSVYEKDDNGNAILLLRDGQSVEEGQEVTITYGDEKGACEMLFSYGFLEQDRTSAETLFLGLTISDDDPQRTGKTRVADCAPGFKIIDTGDGEIDWTGDFIWLLCVNSDDGLTFQLARTVDGADDEMEAFFQDTELKHGAAQLYSLLGKSDLWDVYRLRAIAILQQKVFDQMQVLYGTQDEMEAVPHGPETGMRERCYQQAMQLRKLEFELLERAYEDFEKQKLELAESDVVKQYLAQQRDEDVEDVREDKDHVQDVEDDFS